MSDLRDRIAAAIKEVDDMRVCKLSNADIKFMADAVIAELGLREEVDLNCTDEGETVSLYRYVTNWNTPLAE